MMFRHAALRIAVLAGFVLAGCATPDPAPTAVPVAPVEAAAVPAVVVPYEPWMGPMPNASPSIPVGSSAIPNAVAGAPSGESTPRIWNEPQEVAGITDAHSAILSGLGRPAMAWSDRLAGEARLQVAQMGYLCQRQARETLSSASDAVRFEPAGRNGAGEAKPVNLSPRQIVEDWSRRGAGAFSQGGRRAIVVGCAMRECDNSGRIWTCRYE